MPATLDAMKARADNLGLTVIAGRGGGRGGLFKVFGTRGADEWFASSITTLKGKGELEAFLDGFLVGRRQDVGELKGSIAEASYRKDIKRMKKASER